MKVILVVGVLVFALVIFAAYAMKRVFRPDETQRASSGKAQSPFDGVRAFKDLEAVVGFGPRPSGSEALEKCRDYIRRELKAAGLEVRELPFEANTPLGRKHMVNIAGVVQGTAAGIILLGNHYETKFFPDFTFVGANDGGSTTAWMIEMARVLGPRRDGRSIWLCFFDGEEAFKNWTAQDSLYGSRQMVQYLRDAGLLAQVHAMINVDMIGDSYLGIQRDADAPPWLVSAIWNRAQVLGYGGHFLSRTLSIEDDHAPFRRAGIPAIDLIDFVYGGSFLDHQRNWHTPSDTIDRVSASSLQVVGDVVFHALPDIEAYLDAHAPQ